MSTVTVFCVPICDSLQTCLDEKVAEVSQRKLSRVIDVLLELRMVAKRAGENPVELLDVFLRNRRQLAHHDYLWTHRFRRQLEQSFLLRVTAGDEEKTLPLDLVWNSFEQLSQSAKHSYFENSRADWSDIAVAIEAQS